MGMSSSVSFLRSPDNPQYQKMLKARHACEDAGIDLPQEIRDYFSDQYGLGDDEAPLTIDCNIETEYREEMQEGFEIRIKDIPDGVDVIRFVNSY